MFKWVYFIVLAIVAATGIWYIFLKPQEKGTPRALAHRYIDAVVNRDDGTIRSLCTDERVAGEAIAAAGRMRGGSLDTHNYTFKTVRDPMRGETGLTAMLSGGVLLIEMDRIDGAWKVVLVDFAG